MREIFTITTLEEYTSITEKYKILIFKASAEWCKPCKIIEDLFYELVGGLPDNVPVILIDYDNSKEIKRKLHIRSIPYVCSIIDGDVIDVVNSANKPAIKNLFSKLHNKIFK